MTKIAVNKIDRRIDQVESKLDGFNRRLDNVELKVNAELNLQKQENDAKIINLSNQLAELQRFKEQREKEIILQDSFNKRLNILIHGLEEAPSQAWETRNQTKTVYDSFLREALDLNPSDMPIADIHRLPQRPIFKAGKKMTRPIIVKLTNALDKSLIFSQLRKLKQYNAKRTENNQSREPVFITEHLPPAFQQQKKSIDAILEKRLGSKDKKLNGELLMPNTHHSSTTKHVYYPRLLPINLVPLPGNLHLHLLLIHSLLHVVTLFVNYFVSVPATQAFISGH